MVAIIAGILGLAGGAEIAKVIFPICLVPVMLRPIFGEASGDSGQDALESL